MGLSIFCYGNLYSDIAVQVLYGEKWGNTHAGDILRVYCLYVLTMAINGVTEAISMAKATHSEIYTRQNWMFVLFV